jgi:hypothetical protein
MKCIICGRKEGDSYDENGEYKLHLKKYKLPHGTIYLCNEDTCSKHLTLQINNFASPIMWVSEADLFEEDSNEHITKEELENLTAEELIELADNTADYIWNGNFGDTFHDAIDDTVEQWREEKEKKMVETTPEKELPLLIENLKYKRNKELLEKRLKGDK